MVREFLAQIEPMQLTASPHGKPVRCKKVSWWRVGLAVAVALIVIGHIFGWPEMSSFVSCAVIVLLVAGMAYVALAGELGDETTRWQTSSIFIVVTVGIVYALYLSRQGSEPAVEPASIAIAVLMGSCAAGAYGQIVRRERDEKWFGTALVRIRAPTAEAFEASLPFQSASGAVWAIDPSRRALRAIAPDSDRSFVWDEPIRAVELRRRRRVRWSSHVFDCQLSIRSGGDSASEWTFVLEFPGPHRDTAARWRKIFEDWVIEDSRRTRADR